MTDSAFRNELWICCYKSQIDGYPLGHPGRMNFQPIVTFTDDRLTALNLPSYAGKFTPEETALLLAET